MAYAKRFRFITPFQGRAYIPSTVYTSDGMWRACSLTGLESSTDGGTTSKRVGLWTIDLARLLTLLEHNWSFCNL